MNQNFEALELGRILINYLLRKQVNVLNAIQNLGAVQIDPVSVVAPNHHLVLGSRIANYRKEDLEIAIESKKLLEVYAHEKCLVPIEDIHLYWNQMIKYRHKYIKIYESYEDTLKKILFQMENKGPMSTRDFESVSIPNENGWGPKREITKLLDFLWQAGYIAVVRRQGNDKWFDLIENVVPQKMFEQNLSLESIRILRWERYFQSIGCTDLSDSKMGFEKTNLTERKQVLKKMISLGIVKNFKVKNSKREYFALSTLNDNIDFSMSQQPVLLAPLDNLLWNRQRLEDIWKFYYRWEIYTTPSKRKVGAYGMPLIGYDRILGQADVQFDRKNKTLILKKRLPLPSVNFSVYIETLEEAANKLSDLIGANNMIVIKDD